MGDRLSHTGTYGMEYPPLVGRVSRYVTSQLGQLSLTSLRGRLLLLLLLLLLRAFI